MRDPHTAAFTLGTDRSNDPPVGGHRSTRPASSSATSPPLAIRMSASRSSPTRRARRRRRSLRTGRSSKRPGDQPRQLDEHHARDRPLALDGRPVDPDAAAAADVFVTTKPHGDRNRPRRVWLARTRADELLHRRRSTPTERFARSLSTRTRARRCTTRSRLPPSSWPPRPAGGRVLIVLTDGKDVSSRSSLDRGDRGRTQRGCRRVRDRDCGAGVHAATAPGAGDARPAARSSARPRAVRSRGSTRASPRSSRAPGR